MPYVIRHKETGKIMTMRSGKSAWRTAAHAKASWKTSGLSYAQRQEFSATYRGSFDAQEMFEIVEAKLEISADMKQALALLKEATFELEPGTLVYQINRFLKEVKQ